MALKGSVRSYMVIWGQVLHLCLWFFRSDDVLYGPMWSYVIMYALLQICLTYAAMHDTCLFTLKMWMFAKKIELNPLTFDQDIRVLSSKKNILKIFHFFAL